MGQAREKHAVMRVLLHLTSCILLDDLHIFAAWTAHVRVVCAQQF